MYLKIFLSLLIVILLAVKHTSSPFDAPSTETINKGLDLKKTAIQNFETKNFTMTQPDKKTKEQGSTTHAPTSPPQKESHSTDTKNINTNIEKQGGNIENKSEISGFIKEAQEQEVQKTEEMKDVSVSPFPTRIQITSQPSQEIEVKSIKNFIPIIECLDSEKNYLCPDIRI